MKKVVLSKPIAGARGPVAELQFREPRFEDWMEFGDIESPMAIGSGEARSVMFQQHPAVIGAYAERLLQDQDVNVLRVIGLRDTLAVKDAIIGFFREAEKMPETSSAVSPTSSSS